MVYAKIIVAFLVRLEGNKSTITVDMLFMI